MIQFRPDIPKAKTETRMLLKQDVKKSSWKHALRRESNKSGNRYNFAGVSRLSYINQLRLRATTCFIPTTTIIIEGM
ncbi:hypothetical protein MRB53_010671 [Persea americana]|uniref:Uncharacterized protein n=1 Tax=Persea americana TaxID=3435 RepID=A0ACC2LTN7_PERAE|nr:hypothetical protein MRB53_010671 [Persea americana]